MGREKRPAALGPLADFSLHQKREPDMVYNVGAGRHLKATHGTVRILRQIRQGVRV